MKIESDREEKNHTQIFGEEKQYSQSGNILFLLEKNVRTRRFIVCMLKGNQHKEVYIHNILCLPLFERHNNIKNERKLNK